MILLTAACGDGAGGEAALSEGPAATITTPSALSEPAAASTTVAGSTTTSRPGARATTTTAGASASTTAPPRATTASPLDPPAAGTYRYATQGQSTFGTTVLPFPGVSTLVVDPPDGKRQRAVRDLRNAGNGPLFEYVLDYRPDGIHLISLTAAVSFLLFSQQESLRPSSPVLFLPTGATAGSSREVDVPTSTGGTAHLVIETRSPTVVHLTATLTGQLSNRIELTVTLDRTSRVWVQERLVAEATAPTGEVAFRSEYTATLQR